MRTTFIAVLLLLALLFILPSAQISRNKRRGNTNGGGGRGKNFDMHMLALNYAGSACIVSIFI